LREAHGLRLILKSIHSFPWSLAPKYGLTREEDYSLYTTATLKGAVTGQRA
jgi:hypothetical protein